MENKRLKIDMVHEPSINHRLIPATGRVPQGKKGVTGHYRPGQLGGAGEVEFPVSRLVANPVEVSGSPGRVEGQPKQSFLGVSPTAFTPLIYGLPPSWITLRGRKATVHRDKD